MTRRFHSTGLTLSMANPSHITIKPRFTIQNLHVTKARQYSVMACQIFTPLALSTEALYHFVHSDSLCTLKGFQLKKKKKDIIYISVHDSNKHTPSPSGILKARYLRFPNIFNNSITNLNIHFRFYKKTPPWNMCIITKKKNYSFKELKRIASMQETSFSLLHV